MTIYRSGSQLFLMPDTVFKAQGSSEPQVNNKNYKSLPTSMSKRGVIISDDLFIYFCSSPLFRGK